MKKVNWKCPTCENENTVDVSFYDFEMGLLLTDECSGCKKKSDMTINSTPAVQSVISKA